MKTSSRLLAPLLTLLLIDPSVRAEDSAVVPGTSWKHADPASVGWNPVALQKAIDMAMSRKSSGIVVVVGGTIIAEKFAEVDEPSQRYLGMVHGKDKLGHPIEDVASCQKSVASVLVGIAQDKGLMEIDDAVQKYLGKGWSNASPTQEKQITIRHLISMNSGLDDRLRFVAPPNTKWKYNTNAYSLSLRAVAAAAKRTPNEITKMWLTRPLGMKDSRWIERKLPTIAPPETNKLGFATTAHDLARFGLLALRRGQWSKAQVVSADFLKQSAHPSQKINPAYGFLWWLNGQKYFVRGQRTMQGPLNTEAPSDMFAALGALGRKCYVVPSLDLVVTRLGDEPNTSDKKNFDLEFWRLMSKAAPKTSKNN